jgi:hypothetical protein
MKKSIRLTTPEFWKQVKNEYLKEPHNNLFVSSTSLFDMWHYIELRLIIKHLSKLFLIENSIVGINPDVNTNNLFTITNSDLTFNEVNLMFIDWCINYFTDINNHFTVGFWENLKNKFIQNEEALFLCQVSEEFDSLFKSDISKQIKEWAEFFLKEQYLPHIDVYKGTYCNTLFQNCCIKKDHRKIRLRFIDFMIYYLTNYETYNFINNVELWIKIRDETIELGCINNSPTFFNFYYYTKNQKLLQQFAEEFVKEMDYKNVKVWKVPNMFQIFNLPYDLLYTQKNLDIIFLNWRVNKLLNNYL